MAVFPLWHSIAVMATGVGAWLDHGRVLGMACVVFSNYVTVNILVSNSWMHSVMNIVKSKVHPNYTDTPTSVTCVAP